jgi:hypothetical protein
MQQLHERELAVRGASIEGCLDLAGATVPRPLAFQDCLFLQKPVFSGATMKGLRLSGCRVPGLEAEELDCTGSVHLDEDFDSTGEIRLAGATIKGQLCCSRARVTTETRYAINAQGIKCSEGVFLDGAFVAKGEVNFAEGDIGLALVCSGATLRNPDGFALNAQGLQCRGTVALSEGFSAEGEVSLARANLVGQLTCEKGTFRNGSGCALNLEGLVCRSDVFLNDGFSATGEVSLAGASVAGQLSCSGGTLTNPSGCALNGQGLECRGDIFLRSGFCAEGEINLVGANVSGQVSCMTATVAGSLILQGARVGEQFFWSQIRHPDKAVVNLDGAHVATLVTDRASAPQQLILNRLTYDAFDPIDNMSLQLSWLAGADFDTQPYQELARVLRQHGHTDSAISVLMAGEKRRLREQSTRIPERLRGWVLAWTLGHGYRPGRAVIWLTALWLLGWRVFAVAGRNHLMLPAPNLPPSDGGFGWLEALFYSLDTMLPVINLGVGEAWNPSRAGTFVWIYWRLHVALGWLFSTLAVLGFTGLVRKKD